MFFLDHQPQEVVPNRSSKVMSACAKSKEWLPALRMLHGMVADTAPWVLKFCGGGVGDFETQTFDSGILGKHVSNVSNSINGRMCLSSAYLAFFGINRSCFALRSCGPCTHRNKFFQALQVLPDTICYNAAIAACKGCTLSAVLGFQLVDSG